MKKFKKLIPAFCAMLVSAAMLGASTYAWFSVNKKVEAKDMSVTAKAATEYFAVLGSLTGSEFTTGDNNVLTEVANLTCSQKGNVYDENSGVANYQQYVNPVAFTSAAITQDTLSIAAKHWYTATINKYDAVKPGTDSTVKYQSLTDIGEATSTTSTVYTNASYFVGYTFYVGLADNTADFTGYLKFAASAEGSNGVKIAGVKVNGKIKDENSATDKYVPIEDFTGTIANQKGYTENEYVLTSKKGDTVAQYVTVTVYVFIDGTAANVKDSSNVTALTGSVSITVTGEDTRPNA